MIVVAVAPSTTIAGRSPLDKPPAVLVDRAQQILASLGYTDADRRLGLRLLDRTRRYLRWIATHDHESDALGRVDGRQSVGAHVVVSHQPAAARAARCRGSVATDRSADGGVRA